MLFSKCVSAILVLATSVSSSILPIRRSSTCTVKSSNGTSDDSPAFLAAAKACAKDATIVFSAGVDYNIFTPVNATLNNVEIKLLGNLHLPQNITQVQLLVNTTAATWFIIKGSHVSLTGTTNVSTGWIYSYGQQWWDANPVNGTGILNRPHLMQFNVSTGTITNFKSSKPIAWGVSILGNNIHVKNSLVEASTTGGFPFNTDGFDIAATNVLVEDSVIINGDDAFAVTSGSENVTISRAFIGGPGCHGTSIGSLGQNQGLFATVSNVLFTDVTAVGSVYGARFKSWVGGQGLAKNITWRNYNVHNVTYPIYVTQNYINQGNAQTQIENGAVTGRPNNASVLMRDFTWLNWKGDINTYNRGDRSCVTDPCWYDVPGADGTQAAVIQCANATSCENFSMSNIQIVPQSYPQSLPSIICQNVAAAPSLGFVCQNGTFTAH
ncbi:hypothetical protein FRB93_002513 [Tulasnella sp. JGI-2019a]|nr:hypothetical protein FRB93_002513 [Tulasnella sp. JGI-2019a]